MDDHCQLNIAIEDEGLCAYVLVPESLDRDQLSFELCQAAMMQADLELASCSKQLVDDFLAQAKACTGPFKGLIAKGVAPVHGQDARVEWDLESLNAQPDATAPPSPDDKPAAQGDAPSAKDEAACFYNRSIYTVVKQNDVLGKVYHAVPGEDGRDVKGRVLVAREGRPLNFQHDETIKIGKGNTIVAMVDGVLDRSGSTACIRDTIEVDRYVDFNTGNISFNGSVLIQKGVRDCFKVQADGDVEVRGLIEAAQIICGKDLRALGGFAGREQGVAEVAGNLQAKYLDAVRIMVRGDLIVERELINCETRVLGQIASPRGSVIGGQTLVAGGLTVAELGAAGLPMTLVQLGVVPHLDPLVAKLGKLLEHLIEQRQKLLDEQKMIENTSGKYVSEQNKERLCELMYEIADAQMMIDRAEPAYEKAREKADAMRHVAAQVERMVYPNTTLVCTGIRYRIKNELKGPLRIFEDNKGRLQVERNGQGPVMLAKYADLGDAA